MSHKHDLDIESKYGESWHIIKFSFVSDINVDVYSIHYLQKICFDGNDLFINTKSDAHKDHVSHGDLQHQHSKKEIFVDSEKSLHRTLNVTHIGF